MSLFWAFIVHYSG